MIHGRLKDDELWIRCWRCGDSTRDRMKAHCSINVNSGAYYCFKCGTGGRLPAGQVLPLILAGLKVPTTSPTQGTDILSFYEGLLPGPASPRFSLLDRLHTERGEDVFLSRGRDGETIGFLVFDSYRKRRRFIGERGIGYAGESLVSSPDDPLYLVEGPFDVVQPRYVSMYGMPTSQGLRYLAMQYLVLYPDGDVWGNRQVMRSLAKLIVDHPLILGAVRLPDGTDPDTAGDHRRYDYVARDYFVRLHHEGRRWDTTRTLSRGRRVRVKRPSLSGW